MALALIGELVRPNLGRAYCNQPPAQDALDLLPSVAGELDRDVVLVLGRGDREGVQGASLGEGLELGFGAEEHSVAYPLFVPRARSPTNRCESIGES